MAMAIHATRQHQRAGGIHHARPIGELFAEGNNAPVLHADIAARGAEAGRNLSATHYKVKFRHGHPLLLKRIQQKASSSLPFTSILCAAPPPSPPPGPY